MRVALHGLIIAAVLLSACSDSDDAGPTTTAPADTPAAPLDETGDVSPSADVSDDTISEEPATGRPVDDPETVEAGEWPDDDPRSEFERLSIAANGFTFEALAAGPPDGELVLLLHGFPQAGWEWRHQLRTLGDAGYRVVAPDQRGYSPGARPPAVEDYGIVLLADDVMDIVTELGVERYHVVGHDWGAGVAWTLGLLDADRLASLTAVSVPHPSAYARALEDPDGDQSSKVAYIGLFTSEGAVDTFLADDASFLRGIVTDAGGTPADEQVYVDVLGTPEAIDAALNWYRATDLLSAGPVPAVTVPTLYVWSDGDCCLGRDAAELTVEFVDGPYTYEVIEGVNHWVPEVAADELNRFLLAHFAAFPV